MEVNVSAENLTKREQSTPQELERFVELASATGEENDEWTLLRYFLLESSGMRSTDDGHHYVRRASTDSGLGTLYSQIYPTAGSEERYCIAWADVAAIARTHYLLWDSFNDPSERMYDADKPLFDEAAFGLSLDDERSRFDFPVRTRVLEESPLYRQRLEQGMPRVMQLFVATQAMQRLNGDKHWRQKHANAFYHLPELWDLSDDETKTVTQLVAGNGKYAPQLVSLMVADDRLLERYRGEDGVIDVELYGGREALLANAQDAFKQYIRWGARNSVESQEWLEMESNLEAELADIFPHEARKTMAFEEWLKHPQPGLPDANLLTYISLPEAVRLSQQYIAEDIERFDSDNIRETKISGRSSRRWAARKLDCPPSMVDAATYYDYEELFNIIEAHAEPNAPEIMNFAAHYRTAAESLDNELAGLLKDYYYAATDSGLLWPIEGWSGAPEEEEVARQMSAERDDKFKKLHNLEDTIREKVSTSPKGTS